MSHTARAGPDKLPNKSCRTARAVCSPAGRPRGARRRRQALTGMAELALYFAPAAPPGRPAAVRPLPRRGAIVARRARAAGRRAGGARRVAPAAAVARAPLPRCSPVRPRSSAGRRRASRRPPDAPSGGGPAACPPTTPRRSRADPHRAVVAARRAARGGARRARPPGQPQLPVRGRRASRPPPTGVTVEVLNRDDRLLLHNPSGQDVVIEGYDGEPYARVRADGTVEVNTNSPAYYLNDDRFGDVERPDGRRRRRARRAGRRSTRPGASSGTTTACTGWPRAAPPQVKDPDERTKVFDWTIPIEVGGRRGRDRRHAVLDAAARRRAAAGRDRRRSRCCCRCSAIARRRDRAGAGARGGRPSRRRPGEPRARSVAGAAALLALPPAAASAHAAARGHGARARRARSTERAARGRCCASTSRSRSRSARCGSTTPRRAGPGRRAPSIPAAQRPAVAVALRAGLPDGGYTVTYRVDLGRLAPGLGRLRVQRRRRRRRRRRASPTCSADGDAGPVTVGRLRRRARRAVRGDRAGVGALAVLLLVLAAGAARRGAARRRWRAASDAFAARWRALLLGAAVAGVAQRAGRARAAGRRPRRARRSGRRWPDVPATCSARASARVWGLGGSPGCSRWSSARDRAAPSGARGATGARSLARPLALAALACRCSGAACPALGGHAACRRRSRVLLPANVAARLAAGAWIGGIAVLVLALPRRDRAGSTGADAHAAAGRDARRASRRSPSSRSPCCWPGGILQSLLELSRGPRPASTPRSAARSSIKLARSSPCCSGSARSTAAAPSRAAARRRGRRGARARRASLLRRTLRAELALGVAALAVTGALASYPPADAAVGRARSRPARTLGPARAELTVDPARAGANEIHLYLFDRATARSTTRTKELTRRSASLPDSGIAPIELQARARPGPATTSSPAPPLAPAGDWRAASSPRASPTSTSYRTTFDGPDQVKETAMRRTHRAPPPRAGALAAPAAAGAHVTVQPDDRARRRVRPARRPRARTSATTRARSRSTCKLPPGFDRRPYEPVPGWSMKVTRARPTDTDRGRWPRRSTDQVARDHLDRRRRAGVDRARPVPRLRAVAARARREGRRHAAVQGAPDLRGRRDRALDRPGGRRRAGADRHAHGEPERAAATAPATEAATAGVGAGRSGDGRHAAATTRWPSSPSRSGALGLVAGLAALASPHGGEARHEPPARSSPRRRGASRCPPARRRTRRSSRSARPPAPPRRSLGSVRVAFAARISDANLTVRAPPGAR